MNKEEVKKQIYKNLIVSCQARKGWAMHGSNTMAKFAKAAEEGGASAIRANGYDDLLAIKKVVNLPLLGINKIFCDEYEVYITPTYESAEEILNIGIEMIAIDATPRERPNGETFQNIIKQVREKFPNVLIIGEISTVEEAIAIDGLDIDYISTTLCGYTKESKELNYTSIELLKFLKSKVSKPIISEGQITTKEAARQSLIAGAYSVVVGTAITRPEIITESFVREIKM